VIEIGGQAITVRSRVKRREKEKERERQGGAEEKNKDNQTQATSIEYPGHQGQCFFFSSPGTL
jgi:hypothetical protein